MTHQAEHMTVWHYLAQIRDNVPESIDRINMLFETQDEEAANRVLTEVWSWFENE